MIPDSVGAMGRATTMTPAPDSCAGHIVSSMKAALSVVVIVIAAILVLKIVATVSALVLAFIPAFIALAGGYAVGQIHGARRERRKLEAKRPGQLPL
jgi:hypothetical protein